MLLDQKTRTQQLLYQALPPKNGSLGFTTRHFRPVLMILPWMIDILYPGRVPYGSLTLRYHSDIHMDLLFVFQPTMQATSLAIPVFLSKGMTPSCMECWARDPLDKSGWLASFPSSSPSSDNNNNNKRSRSRYNPSTNDYCRTKRLGIVELNFPVCM